MTYVPTANLSPLYAFTQFSGTVSAFQTALNSAFGAAAGNIQCFADTTSGQTAWAVVVVGDQQVLSVPPNNYIGFNQGQWTQYTPTKLGQLYTVYP
jgi:hypothetical protein